MNKCESTTALSVGQQLDALCWAANEAGVSYGQICSRLSAVERDRVFDRYQEHTQFCLYHRGYKPADPES